MPANYFWNGKEVTVTEEKIYMSRLDDALFNLFVVETSRVDPCHRYGKYVFDNNEKDWLHVPLEEFPKEFRTHLLLLGVT